VSVCGDSLGPVLVDVAIPRIRDFSWTLIQVFLMVVVTYSMGVKEQIIFQNLDTDRYRWVMVYHLKQTARSDEEGRAASFRYAIISKVKQSVGENSITSNDIQTEQRDKLSEAVSQNLSASLLNSRHTVAELASL